MFSAVLSSLLFFEELGKGSQPIFFIVNGYLAMAAVSSAILAAVFCSMKELKLAFITGGRPQAVQIAKAVTDIINNTAELFNEYMDMSFIFLRLQIISVIKFIITIVARTMPNDDESSAGPVSIRELRRGNKDAPAIKYNSDGIAGPSIRNGIKIVIMIAAFMKLYKDIEMSLKLGKSVIFVFMLMFPKLGLFVLEWLFFFCMSNNY